MMAAGVDDEIYHRYHHRHPYLSHQDHTVLVVNNDDDSIDDAMTK